MIIFLCIYHIIFYIYFLAINIKESNSTAASDINGTIKLRKSPFDLSMSHHAHQEIVRGVTTEMSGPTLGLVEIMHWCENVLFMGWIAMFFVWGSPLSAIAVVAVVALVYFLEIWIDNNFARVKWQFMFKSAWLVALVAGGVNIALLAFL